MLDTHDASVSTHAPSFWHVNQRDWGPAQAWTPGHVHGPPLSGPGPQEGAGLLPLAGSPPLALQPAPRTPMNSARASHTFSIVRMRLWPAHFTPSLKVPDLLPRLAAAHDRDVRLGTRCERYGGRSRSVVGLSHRGARRGPATDRPRQDSPWRRHAPNRWLGRFDRAHIARIRCDQPPRRSVARRIRKRDTGSPASRVRLARADEG